MSGLTEYVELSIELSNLQHQLINEVLIKPLAKETQ